MRRLSVLLVLGLFFQLSVQTVRAVSDPPLFTCITPIGEVIATYPSGTHGIPGDNGTYTGSDTVYRIDSDHLLQCFCPDNNQSGIQSNWWKISGLSEEDISFFRKRGWIYVPNGALWGLDEAPYLVRNEFYACQGQGGGSDNGGGGGSSSSSSGGSSSSDSGVGGGAGSVLGVSALAETGSARTILAFLIIGGLFAFAAYKLRRQ